MSDLHAANRRHYPRERYGGKNEWKAVEQHLGEMAEVINHKEAALRKQKAQELQYAYDDQIKSLESVKGAAEAERRREIEEGKVRDKVIADESRRNAVERKEIIGKILSTNYEQMIRNRQHKAEAAKQFEKNLDQVTLDGAKQSLEVEQAIKKEKADMLAKLMKGGLSETEARKEVERVQAEWSKKQYMDQVTANSREQLAKEANYRAYFKQIAEKQRQFQHLHEEKVLSPEQKRTHTLDEIIAKNEADYQKRLEADEHNRLQKRASDNVVLAQTLQQQINAKKDVRTLEQIEHDRKVQESIRKSAEYVEYLNASKAYKQENQRWYKQLLDRQQHEKDEIVTNGHTMTKKEKKINVDPLQAFKGADTSHITALLPGYANSKYIHPYSPEARYAHILQYKDLIVPAQKEHARSGAHLSQSGLDVKGGGRSELSLATQADPNSPTVLQQDDSSSNQRRNLAALLSPQASSNKWESKHNPITNPIPGVMQNPYLISEFRRLNGNESKNPSFLGSIGSRTLTNQG